MYKNPQTAPNSYISQKSLEHFVIQSKIGSNLHNKLVPDLPVSDDIKRTRFYVRFPYLLSKCVLFKKFTMANADDRETPLPCRACKNVMDQ